MENLPHRRCSQIKWPQSFAGSWRLARRLGNGTRRIELALAGSNHTSDSMHDVLIIGAGPAGLAAALWCDELGLDTLVLEQAETVDGQLLSIYKRIENYPGVSVKNWRAFLDLWSTKLEAAEFD